MNKRRAGNASPSKDLKHFTDRENEQKVFQHHLDAAEGAQLPVIMFFGVGGVGKTWLSKRLRESLGDPAIVPSARIDFESSVGGASYCHDSAAAVAEIRRQLSVDCPRFDLAYAMMRRKQGTGDEPLLKHGGRAN